MEYLEKLGSVLVLICIFTSPGIIYYICYRRVRRKIPEETGKRPIFQQIGSLRIDGAISDSVRISLYAEYLILITIFKHYIIPVNAIKSAKLRERKFSQYTCEKEFELIIDPYDEKRYPYIVYEVGSDLRLYNEITLLLMKDNKRRQHIIEALMVLYESSNIVETIKKTNQNAKKELIQSFGISDYQASAVMDLKKPISEIPFESILEEKKNLKQIELKLKPKS